MTECRQSFDRFAISPVDAEFTHRAADGLSILLATLFIGAMTLLFILHPFSPSFPMAGLDASWQAVLANMAADHAQWGTDVIFTYGPAMPLLATYYNGQFFTLTLPILILIGFVHGLLVAFLFRRHLERSRRAAYGLSVLVYGCAMVTQRQSAAWQLPDGFFFILSFIVFLLAVTASRHGRAVAVVRGTGAALLGVIALSKMSLGLAALLLCGLADIHSACSRRPPLLLACFVSAFFACYLLYAQDPRLLASFLYMQWQTIAGYSETMGVAGNIHELTGFLGLCVALLVGVCAIHRSATRAGFDRLSLPVGTAGLSFIVFKAGFVRQDIHSIISWNALGLMALLLGLMFAMDGSRRGAGWICAGAVLILLGITPYEIARQSIHRPSLHDIAGIWRSWLTEGPPDEIMALGAALADPSGFADDLEQQDRAAWRDIALHNPLPKVDGGIDTIASEQSSVIANGLDFRPRPAFQDYATYTPALAAANQAFYAGSRAPRWVLFAPETIDGRLPAFAEGALWPEFLKTYEPAELVNEDLLLRRRVTPLVEPPQPPQRSTGSLGRFVDVSGDRPIFAAIDVRPTLLGRLASFLLRGPTLAISVRLRDGRLRTFRYSPALGRQGFLLSPLVVKSADFMAVMSDPRATRLNDVIAFKIDAQSDGRWLFENDFTIELTPR